jgi:hypothetical protein
MNERIRELAIEAKLIASEPNGFDQNNLSKSQQKFAELIVAEAITVLQKRFMGDLNREDMEVRRCIADVKKHFGDKELTEGVEK